MLDRGQQAKAVIVDKYDTVEHYRDSNGYSRERVTHHIAYEFKAGEKPINATRTLPESGWQVVTIGDGFAVTYLPENPQQHRTAYDTITPEIEENFVLSIFAVSVVVGLWLWRWIVCEIISDLLRLLNTGIITTAQIRGTIERRGSKGGRWFDYDLTFQDQYDRTIKTETNQSFRRDIHNAGDQVEILVLPEDSTKILLITDKYKDLLSKRG